ncbi:MAG: periplasmic heavy metal sensor, partial [Caulobacteraceae bacterium]|nr:periplasmic heavy metal sensor [Caulobacter sp.]
MSPWARNTALAALLCAAAGLGGGWAGVRLGLLAAHRAPGLHQLVHRELRLAPDQSQRMEALERDYASRRSGLEADVRSADAGLAAAIAADEADTPRVEAAVDRVHAALDALQKATVAHVLAMRAVLSPAQRAPFDREVA